MVMTPHHQPRSSPTSILETRKDPPAFSAPVEFSSYGNQRKDCWWTIIGTGLPTGSVWRSGKDCPAILVNKEVWMVSYGNRYGTSEGIGTPEVVILSIYAMNCVRLCNRTRLSNT